MQRVVEDVKHVEFAELLGKRVQLWCLNYIYAGKLVGASTTHLELKDPHVVYETGSIGEKGFSNAEAFLAKKHYVRTATIESYGVVDDE